MKLGFSTLGCPQWELDQIIEAATSAGYDGIELRHYKGTLDLVPALQEFPGGPAAFRSRLQQAGLEVCCLDTSFHLTDAELPFSEAEQMTTLAAELGAPYLRIFGGHVPEGEAEAAAHTRAAGNLSKLGDLAAAQDRKALLETHDAFSSGAQVAALLEKVNHPAVGAIWDMNHPFRQGEKPEKTVRSMAHHVFHTHVKDSNDQGQYTLLGEGTNPIPEMIALLRDQGYTGYICLEWEKAWHPELADPEIAFPQAARYLKATLMKLGVAS
jgi:sugar phosphate isomerase/epimerase